MSEVVEEADRCSCGSELRVEKEFTRSAVVQTTLFCGCGKAADGIAYEREHVLIETVCAWGPLMPDGSFEVVGEDVLDCDEEEVSSDTCCPDCLREAREDDFEREVDKFELDEDSAETRIVCEDAEHLQRDDVE